MIAVRMREKDQGNVQVFLRDQCELAAGIRAGIECDSLPRYGVPYDEGVHGHVFVGRIELGQALRFRQAVGA